MAIKFKVQRKEDGHEIRNELEIAQLPHLDKCWYDLLVIQISESGFYRLEASCDYIAEVFDNLSRRPLADALLKMGSIECQERKPKRTRRLTYETSLFRSSIVILNGCPSP